MSLLEIDQFQDYCPNGLQIEGRSEIEKVVTGVTACEALIDAAIERNADAIIVHHGYFWKGESQPLVGMKANRIRKLIQNDINLLAYHLPLDAHPDLGNNVQLAKLLDINVTGGLGGGVRPIGLVGSTEQTLTAKELVAKISDKLGRQGLLIGAENKEIDKVAWCTGAAQSYIEKAIDEGVDCFISGEISEPTVHIARESGVCYIAAGHHATERCGVKALGEYLTESLDVDM